MASWVVTHSRLVVTLSPTVAQGCIAFVGRKKAALQEAESVPICLEPSIQNWLPIDTPIHVFHCCFETGSRVGRAGLKFIMHFRLALN